MTEKPRIRVPATNKPTFTVDSFQNLNQRLGLGTGSQLDGSAYAFTYISRNRMLLEAAYRTSWIVGQAVDTVAEDMTSAGVSLNSTLDPADEQKIMDAWSNLNIGGQLGSTEKWARLYGGALGFMMIDGQDPATPLNLGTIKPGQFRGILPLDRWVALPDLSQLVTEFGPDFGLPAYYRVFGDQLQATPIMTVHYSRVIRRIGIELPYYQRQSENLWGESVIERFWDRLLAFDSATQGAAQLVFKAYLRTLSVEGYRDLVATGGKLFEGFAKMVENIRYFQNTEGLTVVDSTDKFETHTYTFAGLDDLILQFAQQVSGALEIPMVRLFGQSPAGLNSTGESDLRTYYDGIRRKQDNGLRPGVGKLLQVMCRSVLGKPAPEGFGFSFVPLWQMSEKDKAEIADKTTTAVDKAFAGGMITAKVAAQELQASSRITGIFSNITAENIDEMEDTIPEPVEMAPVEEEEVIEEPVKNG